MQKQYTLQAYFFTGLQVFPILIIAILLLFRNDTPSGLLIAFASVVCTSLIGLVRVGWWRYRLRQEDARFQSYCQRYPGGDTTPWQTSFIDRLGVLTDIPDSYDLQVSNLYADPAGQWCYGRVRYSVAGSARSSTYRQANVYYRVLIRRLPRALPNVFFDSSRAAGRQFRFQFATNQKRSLEGNFDQYFTTYAPADYAVDMLSFITPEVMLALQEGAAYDIEIIGDRLVLYGAQADIADMATTAERIYATLMHNIVTYRDERLPYAQGRMKVAPLGAQLRRRRHIAIATVIGVALYVVIRIYFEYWHYQQ